MSQKMRIIVPYLDGTAKAEYDKVMNDNSHGYCRILDAAMHAIQSLSTKARGCVEARGLFGIVRDIKAQLWR
jgi:hypothetical protein